MGFHFNPIDQLVYLSVKTVLFLPIQHYKYNLKLRTSSSFLKHIQFLIVLVKCLFFYIKFGIILSRSVNKCSPNLMGITLNLWITFEIAMFTMLFLPIHEHGRNFHHLISSSISDFKNLKLLSYKSHLLGLSYQGTLYYLRLLQRVLF